MSNPPPQPEHTAQTLIDRGARDLRALRDAGQLEQVPDSREDPARAALEHLERGERALSALRRIEDAAAVIRGSL